MFALQNNTCKIHTIISASNVKIEVKNITVILLSFEKFLSRISATNPTIPSDMAFIPILNPINKSINKPKIIPKIKPAFFFINKPISIINITNKFGITPAILNHVKKLDP